MLALKTTMNIKQIKKQIGVNMFSQRGKCMTIMKNLKTQKKKLKDFKPLEVPWSP